MANDNTALNSWLSDPAVTGLTFDGAKRLRVERHNRLEQETSPFESDEQLLEYIEYLAKRSSGAGFDHKNPLGNLQLPDGSSASYVLPPVADPGPALVIKKFIQHRLSLEDLLEYGALSQPVAEFLRLAVTARLNILVAGGINAGKTSVLNVLAGMIDPQERVIFCGETRDLNLPNALYLLANGNEITVGGLVNQAVRMRPDRLIVSELQGEESLALVNAINSGHAGTLASLHATGVRDALSRLETHLGLASPNLPQHTIREQLGTSLDVIVQILRLRDGVRRIVAVAEVEGLVGANIATRDIFTFREKGVDGYDLITGEFVAGKVSDRFVSRLAESGLTLPDGL